MPAQGQHGSGSPQSPGTPSSLHAMHNQFIQSAFDSAQSGRLVGTVPTLKIKQPILLIVQVTVEPPQLLISLPLRAFDHLAQLLTHGRKSLPTRFLDNLLGGFPVAYRRAGWARQMKTVQDELLLDLEAIEGVADPLIRISSSGQQMSMIHIIVTVCGPQNVLLPGFTV